MTAAFVFGLILGALVVALLVRAPTRSLGKPSRGDRHALVWDAYQLGVWLNDEQTRRWLTGADPLPWPSPDEVAGWLEHAAAWGLGPAQRQEAIRRGELSFVDGGEISRLAPSSSTSIKAAPRRSSARGHGAGGNDSHAS